MKCLTWSTAVKLKWRHRSKCRWIYNVYKRQSNYPRGLQLLFQTLVCKISASDILIILCLCQAANLIFVNWWYNKVVVLIPSTSRERMSTSSTVSFEFFSFLHRLWWNCLLMLLLIRLLAIFSLICWHFFCLQPFTVGGYFRSLFSVGFALVNSDGKALKKFFK